ncbi:MAG TPA: hypothetical protein VJJ22_03455 [Candidatus Paceibacterota bacterium]
MKNKIILIFGLVLVFGLVSVVDAGVDKTPPVITEFYTTEGGIETSGVPALFFTATDEESGVDHFEASFGGSDYIKVENPYPLDLVTAKKKIVLRAYDKAGNYASSDTEFTPPPAKPMANGGSRSDKSSEQAVAVILVVAFAIYLRRHLRR